jgi:hypothetical protein
MEGYGRYPGEYPDLPCEVCGIEAGACICPECPECGTAGDPACYEGHGLVRSPEQIASMAAVQEEQRAEAALHAAWAEEMRAEMGSGPRHDDSEIPW